MRAVIQKNESEQKEPTPCPSCGHDAIPSFIDIVDLEAGGQRLCDECVPEDLRLVAEGFDCWEHLLRLAELSDITIKRNIVGRSKKLTYSVAAQRSDGQLIVSTAPLLEDAVFAAAHQCMGLEDDEQSD